LHAGNPDERLSAAETLLNVLTLTRKPNVARERHILGAWTIRWNGYFDSKDYHFVCRLITTSTETHLKKFGFGVNDPFPENVAILFLKRIDE